MLGEWTEDLLSEILLNLPVKSLLRFKSVAQSWCALFETPQFISSHLRISKKHSRLLVNYLPPYRKEHGCITKKTLFLDETLEDLSHISIDLGQVFHGEECVGKDDLSFCVTDGLFCFSPHPYKQVYLANIATGDLLLLPRLRKPQGISTLPAFPVGIGFQSNFSSNSYKIFFCLHFYAFDMTHGIVQFSVYSSSTGSWRELDDFNPGPYNWEETDSCLIDGIYYWVGKDRLEHDLFILTFRLDDEVFKEIQGPPASSYAGEDILWSRIFEHQGRVWLGISYERDESDWDLYILRPAKFHDLWVMNDDGHWTKQLKIGPLFGVTRILKFWKNGWIFLETVNGVVLLYDPYAEKMRNLGIDVGWDAIGVYTYEESLVKTRGLTNRFCPFRGQR